MQSLAKSTAKLLLTLGEKSIVYLKASALPLQRQNILIYNSDFDCACIFYALIFNSAHRIEDPHFSCIGATQSSRKYRIEPLSGSEALGLTFSINSQKFQSKSSYHPFPAAEFLPYVLSPLPLQQEAMTTESINTDQAMVQLRDLILGSGGGDNGMLVYGHDSLISTVCLQLPARMISLRHSTESDSPFYPRLNSNWQKYIIYSDVKLALHDKKERMTLEIGSKRR